MTDNAPREDRVMSEQRVGLIGVGNMGTPIARAFASSQPLDLYDLDSARAATLAQEINDEAGRERATARTALSDLAGCDPIVTVLPDGAIVRTAVWDSGLARQVRRGTTFIDMSSCAPDDTRALAADLASAGLRLLDAPVSGGVKGAVERRLAIMVGGDEADLERVRPLLDTVAARVLHMGPTGSGHVAKALNNLSSACGLVIATEVLAIAAGNGLDPATMVDLLNVATGGNNATETKMKQQVLSGAFASGFASSLMAKDLRIADSLVTGQPMRGTPLAHAVVQRWLEASAGLPPEADQTAVARFIGLEPAG
jgi:3-hydroxyisobutyrate dehydrogenase